MTTALTFEDFWTEYEPIVHGVSYEPPKGDRFQQRFFSRFEQEDPDNPLSCWLWTRAKTTNGYAWFSAPLAGRSGLAHRYSYALMRGEIPEGLHIDHLCRVRHCVNPWHLEPVSQHENNLRADIWGKRSAAFAARTHCKNDHEWTSVNTYRSPDGKRACRECRRQNKRAFRARTKAAA